MDYDDKALDVLSNIIKLAIKQYLENASFDKTVEGRVIASLGDNKYTVQINEKTHNIKSYSGTTHSVNDVVRVTIPQNDMKKMFILHTK